MDTSSYIQYNVRYSAFFAKPKIGAKLTGRITKIQIQSTNTQQVFLICTVEGDLAAIVSNVDTLDRYKLKISQKKKSPKKIAQENDD